MTNKTLVWIIVGIVVVAGSIGGYYYWQNYRPLKDVSLADMQQASGQNQQAENQPAVQPDSQAASSTAANSQILNGCTRMFDKNKLASNGNISIANRQVEIDVKDYGKIVIELYDKDAPKTVENFLRLTDAGYYTCVTFHRVSKGFVIQGGDPTGTGTGGDSAYGKEFADEIDSTSQLYKDGYKKGVVAMANRGANTNTSQFFIMLADVPLDPAYTIFGKVISGQDVVDKIGQVEITPQMSATDGAPKVPVVMESVKIIK